MRPGTRMRLVRTLAALSLAAPALLFAATVGPLTTFGNGNVADASQVNANFDALKTAIENTYSTAEADAAFVAKDAAGNATLSGGLRLGNVESCGSTNRGQLRWSGSTLDVCTAGGWIALNAMGLGSLERPAASCAAILGEDATRDSGTYWLDPDGTGGGAAFQAFCDMDTAPGGWTVVARFADTNSHFTTAEVNLAATNKVIDSGFVHGTTQKLSDAAIRSLYTAEIRWNRSDNAAYVLYFQPQAIASFSTTGYFTQRCRTPSGSWSVWYTSTVDSRDYGLTSRADPSNTVYCRYRSPTGTWDGIVTMNHTGSWWDQCGRNDANSAGYCSASLNAFLMVR